MDYSGTVSDFGGGERGSSLSSLTTELGDHRQRLPGLSPGGSGGMGLLLAGGPMKQCRSASEMVLDLEDDRTRGAAAAAAAAATAAGGPMKLARTDSFPCRQQQPADLKMQMASNLVRNNSASILSAACSPTNSNASDGTLMTHDGSIVSDHQPPARLIRTDSLASAPAYSFHEPYHYKPAGMAFSMGPRDMGMAHGAVMAGARSPFSASQWQELGHQALIFKYMMAGVPVPPDLLIPIRKSLIGFSAGSHHPSMAGWGAFHLGYAGNMDPEPGRCRRTDGKKWRCSRDVVPDQKYCERHMHRGRHRSRKPVEGQTHAAASAAGAGAGASAVSSATGSASSLTLAAARAPANLRPSVSISNPQQQHQSAGSVLGVKGLSGTMPSGNGGHFHPYPLHVSAAGGGPSSASLMVGKDYRMKGDIDEAQILFSEASGSTINSAGWRSMGCKAAAPVPQPKSSDINGSSLNYNSPQLRTLLGQDFGLVSDAIPINSPHQQQQQQHSFLSSAYGAVDSGGGSESTEGQPLRHFFDDWPRPTRDPSAIAWSDVEEERSHRSCSTTQLSISIPMGASSGFSATNSNSSPRGKLSLSPLKLSMFRDGSGEAGPVAGAMGDPIEMGLGVGMNIHDDRHQRHPHHHQWIPNITLESPMGGPLAEVLQSSTTTPRGCSNSKSGLNLMNDPHGWNHSNASPSADSPPRPTGVQHNITFNASSLSDTSSSATTSKTQSCPTHIAFSP